MANFEEMLQQLHIGATMSDMDDRIIIGSNRIFSLPEGFDPIIAYEGDVNTQIITFQCPRYSDEHDLFHCANKRLRWKNLASGHEGSSVLICNEEDEDKLLLNWEVPAEAFTKRGNIQISISIFDSANGKIQYAWNTSSFQDLQVGESVDSVGYFIGQENTQDYIPAKNEILTINAETRQIIAPSDYNHVFCNYGDVKTAVVYFQVKRYIRGIDLLADDTIVTIYWKITGLANTESSTNSKDLYTVELSDRDSEGLVNIVWKPSEALTNNGNFYSGQVLIQIEITSNGKVWRTSPYDQLEIGTSEFSEIVTSLPENEGVSNGYIIDGTQILDDKMVNTVAGVVKLRTCTETSNVIIRKGELVIVNDDLGRYVGVKIGVVDGDSTLNSPYVALAPETIIRLNGGDASGN